MLVKTKLLTQVLLIVAKTVVTILIVTPALSFWYALILLILERSLPASCGITLLTIQDLLSVSVVLLFSVIVGVMAAIYFTADLLDRSEMQ